MSLPANGAEIHRRCLAMRQALAQCSSPEVMAAVLADLVALWLAALPEPTRPATRSHLDQTITRLVQIYSTDRRCHARHYR